MLTRDTQLADPEKLLNDAAWETPTYSKSIFDNFAKGAATLPIAASLMATHFGQTPSGQHILDTYDIINQESSAPRMGNIQTGLDYISNMAGQMAGFGWLAGGAGALVGRGVGLVGGRVAGALLPDAISIWARKPLEGMLAKTVTVKGAEVPLSAALLGEKGVQTFAEGVGFGIPQGIVDNYNRDTDHIAWGGVARDATNMGAFALGIGSIPFAYGLVKGKINRSIGKAADSLITNDALDRALERGVIDKESYDWYKDFLEHQKDPSDPAKTQELQMRGSDIIAKNGQKVDSVSNEALVEILSHDDMSNLHGAAADQLAANHLPDEQRYNLSNFIIQNSLDKLRDNPGALDGLRGYVRFVRDKLKAKARKLREADAILDDHLLKSVRDNLPFSQKALIKHMRKAGFEESHINQLPVTIPENVKQYIKQLGKIAKLKAKLAKASREGKPQSKQVMRRIAELEKRLPKILTPKEELLHIKNTLLTDEGLPKNWETSHEYHRLLDLSHVWHNARSLLDRVHLDAEYDRQAAFHKTAKDILKIADSTDGRIADPSKVVEYLKSRIESQLEKLETPEELAAMTEAMEKLPSDPEAVLADQSAQIEKIDSPELKESFESIKEVYNEFKSKAAVFKNLIACVAGGLIG